MDVAAVTSDAYEDPEPFVFATVDPYELLGDEGVTATDPTPVGESNTPVDQVTQPQARSFKLGGSYCRRDDRVRILLVVASEEGMSPPALALYLGALAIRLTLVVGS